MHARLLENPIFSDVKVLVGNEKFEFKLHRALICTASPFFKAACRPEFSEGQSGVIILPKMDAAAFTAVVTWIYGGDYLIDNDTPQNANTIVEAFKTASFLQLPSLRSDILNAFLDHVRDYRKENGGNNPPRYGEIVPFTINLVSTATRSDWESICKLTDMVARICWFTEQEALQGMFDSEGGNNPIFFAAIAMSFQRIAAMVLCDRCHISRLKAADHCLDCRTQLVVPDKVL